MNNIYQNSSKLINKYNYSNIVILLHSWYFLEKNIHNQFININKEKYNILDIILKKISTDFSFLYMNNTNFNC